MYPVHHPLMPTYEQQTTSNGTLANAQNPGNPSLFPCPPQAPERALVKQTAPDDRCFHVTTIP